MPPGATFWGSTRSERMTISSILAATPYLPPNWSQTLKRNGAEPVDLRDLAVQTLSQLASQLEPGMNPPASPGPQAWLKNLAELVRRAQALPGK